MTTQADFRTEGFEDYEAYSSMLLGIDQTAAWDEVRTLLRSCPDCTEWNEEMAWGALGLPYSEFNYVCDAHRHVVDAIFANLSAQAGVMYWEYQLRRQRNVKIRQGIVIAACALVLVLTMLAIGMGLVG